MIGKTAKDVRRMVTATMNTLNFAAGTCGLASGLKGFGLYAILDLGNQNEFLTMEAVALGVLGTIAAIITVGGGYWLNSGSNQFRIKMCGVLGFIAFAMAGLRGALPKYENTMNNQLLESMQSYYKDGPHKAARQNLVDHLHATYGCCGYLGVEDFAKHENLPKSCCIESRLIDGKCTRREARNVGCMATINRQIKTGVTWLKVLSFITPCILNGLILVLLVKVVVYKDHIPMANKWKWHY